MSLTTFLHSRGFYTFEGYSQEVPPQVENLKVLSQPPVKTVMEIGFNAGHSAEVFLANNPELTLLSFDLGFHAYGKVAKEYIDTKYPGRHQIIWGDSTKTVPEYINANPGKTFDLIFVDGGHMYDIAAADVASCAALANANTIVAVDDVVFSMAQDTHTAGPTRAWMEAVNSGRITELVRREYGGPRGMVWGRYNI
jgi:predicted O-methyltransferase YrrM